MEVIIVICIIIIVVLLVGLWRTLQQKFSLEGQVIVLERDKKNKAQQLKDALRLQESLLQIMYDAFLVVMVDQKRIITANAKAQEIMSHKLVGETLIVATRSYDLDELVQEAKDYQSEIPERLIEIDRHILRARVLKVSNIQDPVYVVLLRDETELQRLGRARRDMVANISHELRHPITNIGLVVDTLLNGALRKSKRSEKLVKGIRREVDTLIQLVQEMRDLSLIESGHMPVKLMPTQLLPLIDGCVAAMESLAENKTQTLTSDVPEDLVVLADASQMERVIKNIIHNGIKFAPEGGFIKVEANISPTNQDDVLIRITNNGPSIPSEDLPRLFERFYQVDKARSDGTGLGLAIARHIVLSHTGHIWAENLPNDEGVVFFLTLALSDIPVVNEF